MGALLYLAGGCLWPLGDALLALLVSDPLWLARLQTLKGWLHVLLTAALAWWLLLRAQRAEAKHWTLAQELALVARYAPAGMARVDLETMRITWANERLCQWLGMDVHEGAAAAFSWNGA